MSEPVSVTFTVDGRRRQEQIPANTVLLDLLRDRYGMTGVRESCGRGVCGACTVLIDGNPAAACTVFAFSTDGTEIETICGLANNRGLSPVQRAFAERGGFQCGYCTPGMIMLVTALLRQHPDPDDMQIRSWLSSSLCRCTGYQMIIESARRAAELTAEDRHARQ